MTATLREALERSITFFDTADVYGQGDSERLLGRMIRGQRERVIICTKAGLTVGVIRQHLVRWVKPFANPIARRWSRGRRVTTDVRERSERQCFEPAYIRSRIEGSLRRLATDYVDIFLLHSPPAAILEQGELFSTLDRMRQAGMVRHYGVSCRSIAEARMALQIDGVSCLQLEVNLFSGPDVDDVLGDAVKLDVGIIARAPFGRGVILDHPAIAALSAASPEKRAHSELALKWLQQREDVATILAGVTCRRHLRANLAALDATPLSEEEIASISRFRLSAHQLSP